MDISKTNIWIFQAHPNRFDLLNALADSRLKHQRWQVNQHRDEIKKGDVVLLWMAGKRSGIYAIAEVIFDPTITSDLPEEEKYWLNDADRGRSDLKVDIKIKEDLRSAPLFRQKLKNIPDLQNLSILRFSQGTNFPVTKKEWSIIQELLGSFEGGLPGPCNAPLKNTRHRLNSTGAG